MMNKNRIAIVLGLVCLLLSMAITVQINTIKRTSIAGSKNFAQDNLKDEVLRWKEKYETETRNLANSEKELAKIREDGAKKDTSASAKEAQIKLNNNLLGLTDLEGKGIELTIKDDPNVTTENIGIIDDISNHIVHEQDLRAIVNELKNAGAEAISINEQRITTNTSINCIGNVIKIDDEKISSPFVIKAIGFPEIMESALARGGGYLDYMDDYGIVISLKKLEKVKIPKYTGVISSKYIK